MKSPTCLGFLAEATVLSLLLGLCASVPLNGTSLPLAATTALSRNRSKSPKEKISSDLKERITASTVSTRTVKVVLQFNSTPSAAASEILSRANVNVRSELHNLNTKVVELPESAVAELA